VTTSVVVATPERSHDLHSLLPIGCDTCHAVAEWQLEFDRINHGEIEPIRWHICNGCLPSCLRAATAQNQGITPPLVSELVA
jgi:hypothetical protein